MERRWKNLRKGQTRGHSTYNVRDLDLTRPAAAKNPSRSQFKTTTVEVLRKTDLKALDSSPTFLQKLELSSREARC
ncbi:hypothetical protein BS78_01G186500 [Paspalum vaginatum]|nr:hypothetical protein BS78_01G186500 [Paspalum vaginatum]